MMTQLSAQHAPRFGMVYQLSEPTTKALNKRMFDLETTHTEAEQTLAKGMFLYGATGDYDFITGQYEQADLYGQTFLATKEDCNKRAQIGETITVPPAALPVYKENQITKKLIGQAAEENRLRFINTFA
jgi:hypothetical protein